MKTKKVKLMALALLGALALNGSIVLASNTNRPFTAFSLPVNKGNNTSTPIRQKQYSTNYSYVKATAMTNTTMVNFWIMNGSNWQISQDVTIPVVSSFYVMNYTRQAHAGDNVHLGMENAYNSNSVAFVSGEVDYD